MVLLLYLFYFLILINFLLFLYPLSKRLEHSLFFYMPLNLFATGISISGNFFSLFPVKISQHSCATKFSKPSGVIKTA